MKTARLFLALAATPAFAVYTYVYSQVFVNSPPTSVWTQNGALTAGASGLVSTDANGGSLIYNQALDGTQQYEVKADLNLTSSGGTYVLYLRATLNARTGPPATGTFYAVELRNPQVNGAAELVTLKHSVRVERRIHDAEVLKGVSSRCRCFPRPAGQRDRDSSWICRIKISQNPLQRV